jgi:DNA helicase HerA-like ATPase
MQADFRLPNDSNRHAVIGMTGSGKTQAGIWSLSLRSYDKKPWVIVDFKHDDLIARIPGLEEIDWRKPPPKKAGLYVIRPLPDDQESVDDFLWKIWARENTGLFIDEGYMLDRFSKPLKAILTQGRSKKIPVISLTQRPAWISPFLLSESEFLQIFYLHTPVDLKKMREWVPFQDMPKHGSFHSLWYDVGRNKITTLGAVPDSAQILQRFEDRRPKRRPLF